MVQVGADKFCVKDDSGTSAVPVVMSFAVKMVVYVQVDHVVTRGQHPDDGSPTCPSLPSKQLGDDPKSKLSSAVQSYAVAPV